MFNRRKLILVGLVAVPLLAGGFVVQERSATDGAPIRVHHVPRRDLEDPAQLGREELSQRHLLQRR